MTSDEIDFIANLLRLMGPKNFFTPTELVKMGIYGSKSSVWRAVHSGEIEAIQISDRRWVILKESIIENITGKKRERWVIGDEKI